MYKETLPKNEFSGCCNVRVYKARFGFAGLKLAPGVTSARVAVRMIHSGQETLVDQLNGEHEFTHESISVMFSFNLFPDGIKVVDDGNIAMSDVDKDATSYAPPGPFTTWTVDLTDTDTTKLDFSSTLR